MLAKPWMMLNPETLAVMEPRVEAASAVVDRCPMDTTAAITRENSNRCVLGITSTCEMEGEKRGLRVRTQTLAACTWLVR